MKRRGKCSRGLLRGLTSAFLKREKIHPQHHDGKVQSASLRLTMFHRTILLVGFVASSVISAVCSLPSSSLSRQSRRTCRGQLHMVPMGTESSPRQLVSQGMQLFQQGDINGSIDLFDRADAMDKSIRPFLWQRGISYYYADRFQEGSEQFRYDVRVNPLVRGCLSLSGHLWCDTI